jgi:peroxiredoxin
MANAISGSMKAAAYGVAALCSAALFVHFGVSLPDAISRGREGVRRTREAPCQVLRPTPMNAVLGKLPVRAPDFTLKLADGTEVKLSSLLSTERQKGRVVLLNFWATWCSTCVVEMPSLERLAADLRAQNKPVTVLAVSVDENWDLVRNFLKEGSAMTILLDKDKSLPGRYGTEKFPESFLIDPDGNIRYYIVSERQIWHTKEVRDCLDALAD